MLFRTIHDIALSNSTPLTDVRPPSASAISRIAAAMCRCSIARSPG
jgi:hypothetical protein